uniref:RNase H type-1 domain-containing protein n=1 Tax=Chenopodium quinoa TaxID=63459 RepID=A0A803LVU4_CHEQI
MAATCVQIQGCFEIDIAEAMAARFALLIAMEAGFNRVILEMDNLKFFSHVGRRGNRVAHVMANCSTGYVDIRVWIMDIPPCASAAVSHDLSCLN